MYTSSAIDSQSNIANFGDSFISAIQAKNSWEDGVKLIVDQLVLDKFGSKFDSIFRRCLKRRLRKRHDYESTNTEIYVENDFDKTINNFSETMGDCSIGTEDISRLISPEPRATKKFGKISRELELVKIIIAQILKALHTSSSVSNIKARLEAEKLLIINTIKEVNLANALLNTSKVDEQQIFGKISIKNMQLHNSVPAEDDEFFLCVLHTESQIFSTEIVRPNKKGVVTFDSNIEIAKLLPDFKIFVKFYKATVEKRHRKIYSLCTSFESVNLEEPKPFLFTLWGQTEITVDYISQPEKLIDLSNSSSNHRLSVVVTAEADLDSKFDGFLNIENQDNNSWSKYWCELEGEKLFLWHCPNEATICRLPSNLLNLRACTEVRIPSRDECATENSFVLNIRVAEELYCDFYLSAESHRELVGWTNYLTATVEAVRLWNDVNMNLSKVIPFSK